jgi:dephospho-CoA kinase
MQNQGVLEGPPVNKKVLAIVGMAGCGKTEAVKYLQEKFKWPKVYFPETLFEELQARGLEFTQDNERPLREELREKEGLGVFATRSLPKIEDQLKTSPVVILESLYSWAEYKIIKQHYPDFFRTIAIYSSPAMRFARLRNRPERPITTYEEFQKRDWTEIENTDKGGPIAIADYTISNLGALEALHQELDQITASEGLV